MRKHIYNDSTEYVYRPFAGIADYENAIIVWAEPNKNIKLLMENVETALKIKRIKATNQNNNKS